MNKNLPTHFRKSILSRANCSLFLFCNLLILSSASAQCGWTEKAPITGNGFYYAAGFSVGTKAYIGTGIDTTAVRVSFFQWNQATNTWTQKADFGGVARRGAVGFSIGNKGYIGTGTNSGGTSLTDFWEYDTTANSWSQKADFGGSGRRGAVGFSIGPKGYIGTGWDGVTVYGDFWEWNSGNNTWTQKADFGGIPRKVAAGFSIGAMGYIGTGQDEFNTDQTDFWEYDTTANSWTQKADFGGGARNWAAGFSVGTKGYIGTGWNGTYTKDFWEWNQSNDTWTKIADLPSLERQGAIGLSIGSKGYVGLGVFGSFHSDFWEYDPNNLLPNIDISLANSCPEFDTTMVGANDQFVVSIYNNGCSPLNISNVTSSSAQFSIVYFPPSIPVGTSENLIVYFSPTSTGSKSTTITVFNNDADTTFCLQGFAIPQYPASGCFWSQKTDFGLSGRYSAVGFSINGKGYIGTGFDALISSNTNDFWQYDTVNSTWTQKANFGGSVRNSAVGFSIGNKGYIGTGDNGGTLFNDFWEYDPSLNTWVQKTDLPGNTRWGASGFSVGSKGYVGTGFDGTSYLQDFWEYDPAFNTWLQRADYGGGERRSAVAFSIGTKGYIGTGTDNIGGVTNDFWEYNPSLNTWVQKANFGGISRRRASGFAIGTMGYLGIGYDGANALKDLWEFNSSNNTWTQVAGFPAEIRLNAVGFSIGSKGYIGTGTDLISNFRDFWQYDPSINPASNIDIPLSNSCPSFDTVMVTANMQDTVKIYNSACGILNISNVSSSSTDFQIISFSSTILPFDSGYALIRFAPATTGDKTSTITVFNSNADTAFCMQGVAVPAPTISVTPSFFNINVSCSDSIIDTLSIGNSGAGDLIFNVSPCNFSSSLQVVLDKLNQNFTTINSAIPSRYDFSEGTTGDNIGDGGNDMYDGGNYLNTNLGSFLSYSDNLIINSAAMGTGGKYFTRKYQGLWVFAADINNLNYFEITGNLGADGGGTMDATELTVNRCGKNFKGFVKRVYNAGDPSVNHLIIVEDNGGLSQIYSSNTDDDQHHVTGLSSSTRIYYLLYARAGGGYIDDAATQNIMEKFLDAINSSQGWLIIQQPFSDTLANGESVNIPVEFDASGYNVGTYSDTIFINSNDPANPFVAVSCVMNVTGFPDMSFVNVPVYLGDPYLPVDSLLIGSSDTDTFYIKNSGCDTLKITDINKTLSVYSISDTSFNILPGDSVMLWVSFTPPAPADYYDSLVIYNNQTVDTVIYLFDVGLPPPIISFNPDSFNITLSCGDSLVDTLKIYNSGASNLNYSLTTSGLGGYGSIIYSQAFVSGVTPTTQATAWVNFRQQLIPLPYKSLKVSGSNNPTGVTLTDATAVTNIANAMKTLTNFSVVSGGNTWTVSANGCNSGIILTVNAPVCNCDGGGPSLYVLRPEIGNDNWGGINTATCTGPSQTMIVEFTYGTPFFQISQNADTVAPGDSSLVNVSFNSSGLNAGTYSGIIAVASNDPSNPADTIPINLTVTGTGKLTLTKNCMYLDSIMEFTSKTDSLFIKNTGCDTLKIFNILTQTADFTFILASDTLMPGDSAKLTVTFSPTSTGDFFDTLTVFSNVGDSAICLSGKAFARPIQTHNPDTLFATLACADTISDTLTIYNTGAGNLVFATAATGMSGLFDGVNDFMSSTLNIDQGGTVPLTLEAWVYPTSNSAGRHQVISSDNGGFDWSILREAGTWFVFTGSGSTNTGFSVDLNQWQHLAAVFIPGTGVRFYKNGVLFSTATISFDASDGNINLGRNPSNTEFFAGKIDEARVWNVARTQADVISTMNKKLYGDEAGLRGYWHFDNGTSNDFSGNGFNGTLTNGASVSVPNAPVSAEWLSFTNISDTLVTGDSSQIGIQIVSTGLTVGQYISNIIINSNDPLNSPDTVVLLLNVVGAPTMVLSDSCVFFDTIMEFTNVPDTFYISNTGCDTLWLSAETSENFFIVSNIDSSLVDSIYGYILPGVNAFIALYFNPDSTGDFMGTLTINSNDYDSVVCLNGNAFPRPIISPDPVSFNISLSCCDSITQPLNIHNIGGSDLIYTIENIGGLSNPTNDFLILNHSKSKTSFTGFTTQLVTEAAFTSLTASQMTSNRVIYFEPDWSNYSNLTNNMANLSDYVSQGGIAVINIAGNIGNGTNIDPFGTDYSRAATHNAETINLTNHPYITGNPYGGTLLNTATFNSWGSTDHGTLSNYPSNSEIVLSNTDGTSWIQYKWGSGYVILNTLTYRWGSSPNSACDNLVKYAYYLSQNTGVPWLSSSLESDTVVASDSSEVNLTFNSCGLNVGAYTTNILINSNDPLNPVDTIPVILNVVGSPVMVLSDSCISFDTIMEFTNIADTIFISNTGCDTLWLSAQTSVNFFIDSLSIDSTGGFIPPGDTADILVFFAPDSAGNFTGTLTINSNDYDTVVCLNGVAFPRPTIDVIPDTLNVTLICADTIIVPLIIANNGLTDLNWTVTPPSGLSDDFDPSIDNSLWLSTTGGVANTLCGSVSGNALMFNGNTTREAVTKDLNTINVPSLDFSLKISGGTPGTCEQADFGEDVILEYSTNGGGSWTNITTYIVGNYNNFTVVNQAIPPAAKTAATRFRWRQPNHSGSCCDHWALDNVSINPIQFVSNISPLTGTTIPSDSDTVNVTVVSTGLLIGQYTSSILVNSNDPLNPQVSVPVVLTVTGAPQLVLSDSCIFFDTIMEFTNIADTVFISNTGCDTLWVTAQTSLNFFIDSLSIDSAGGFILPGDTADILVLFAPDSNGNFTGTLALTTNAGDTTICLNGVAFPRPVLTVSPDTINAVFSVCQDSVTIPVTVYNNGGSDLIWNIVTTTTINDDFDPSTDTSLWSFNNGLANTDCGSVSGNALFFNDNAARIAATNDLNTQGGGTIFFYLKISGGIPATCEQADGGEDVFLQYSNNGGGVWTNIATYNPGSYNNFTLLNVSIPAGAKTASTRFRWTQPNHSGNCCDHWALDDISITVANPNIIPNPVSDTTSAGDSTVVNVLLTDSNLTAGNHTFDLIINSNDPLNPSDTVVINIFVDSLPPAAPVVPDTAICFGQTTPDLIAAGDSIRWYSDGALTNLVASGNSFATGETAVGIYTYYVTNTDTVTGCQSLADTVMLSINTAPTQPTANDETVCSDGIIPSLSSTGTIQKWYSDGSLTNLLFTGNPFSTGQTAAGTYTYYVTDSTGGCPASPADTVVLQINNAAIVDASVVIDSICEGSNYTVNGTMGGGATSILWTTDGDGTFDFDTALSAIYTPSANDILAGSVTLTITTNDPDGAGPCAAVFDDLVLVIMPVATVNAGSDDVICSTSNYTLSGSFGGGASSVSWSSLGNGTFTNGNTVNATYNPSANDILATSVALIISTNDPVGPCSAITDTMILTINPAATVNAGADDTICSGMDYTLNGTRGGGASVSLWTTSGDGNFNNASFLNAVYTPGATDISNGTVTLTITTDDPAGPCPDVSDAMIIIINTTPAAPSAEDTTVCSDVTIPFLAATGTNVKWYSDAALTNLAGTGNSFNTNQTAPGSYTYWLTDSLSACPASAADSATLTINPAAVVSAGANDTICAGDTYTLSGSFGGGASSITWTTSGDGNFNNAGLPAATYTPGTNDISSGTVTLTITTDDPAGPCNSVFASMILKINAAPVAPSSSDTSICFGETVPSLTAAGTNLQWYSDAGLTTLVGTGSPFATNDSTVGVHTYYVTDSVSACPASSATTVELTINAIPGMPAVSDTAICFGEPTPDLVAVGDSVRWYDDAALTNLVANNDTFITGVSAVGVYTYYATQTDLLNGCEGPADTVTLSIISIPTAPAASDTAICFGETTPDLVATGTNVQWYDDAGLTNLVGSGNNFASNQTAVGTYTYYATQSVGICESPATTVTLTINAIPAVPVSSDTTICEGSSTPDLVATGTNVNWYDDAGLTNLVASGNNFASGETTPGTYTYYATQTVNNCQSTATTVVLAILPVPSAPAASDTAVCFGNPVPDLSASGTNLKWYSDIALTNLVGTGNSFTTNQTAIGTYTYYVTDSLNSCGQGAATAVTLTIDTFPVAPSAADAAACFGDVVPPLTASGTNLKWYDDAALSNLVFSGSPFNTGNSAVGTYTYFVTSFSAGCGESAADSATLTIYALPSAPATSNGNNCFGSANDSLFASGTSIVWYSDAGLTTQVSTGNSFTPADAAVGTYTYYATQTDTVTGCVSSADSATLTINALPAAPLANDTTVLEGNPVPDLTAIGTNIQWYSDSALTILVGNGNSFATGETAVGSYTYYATQTSVDGCEGDSVAVTLTILPAAPLAADTFACEGGTIPPLVASGTNIQWYSNAGLTTMVFAGDTFNTGDVAAGTYTYYATQTVSGFESPATSATLTINALPVAPAVMNDTAVCASDVIPVLVASGTSINWYSDAGLTTLVGSGDSLNTGQTSAGTYTYYATQTVLGCEGPSSNVTLTIKANPAAPVAADSSTCFGGTVPDLFASGTNVLWYSDSTLTTFVFSGNTFSTGETAAGVYTYYTIDTLNGCASPYTQVNLLISAPSNAPTSASTSNDPTCPGEATTLTVSGTLSVGTLWRWFSASCGGTAEGSGDSIVVSPLTTTTYFVRAEGGCDTSACVNVIVNVTNTLSVAASGSVSDVDSICPGDAAVLSVNSGSLGTGANWNWFAASCGGASIGAGTSINVNPVSTTTYFVRAEGLCNNTLCDSVTVNINVPAAPLSNDETVCEGQTIPDLVASGTNVNWYSDSALVNNVFIGNNFATGNSTTGVYTYYATQTNVAGCEGPATTVVLTINAIPAAPLASDESGCEGEAIPDLVSSGTFIQWYNDAGLTNVVASGDTFSTGEITTGVYTYYVTDSVVGCEGPSSTVTLTINAIPFSPTTSSGSGCSGDSVANVFAVGTNIQWYADSAMTSFVSSGDTLTPGLLPVGTYTYYATQTVNGCESAPDSSVLTVFPSPSAPVSSDETVCEGQSVPDLVASGVNVNWYDDSLLTNNVFAGDTLVTGNISAGTYTYYATDTENGCASASTTVVLTINAISAAPSASDVTACASGIIPDLTASGTNVNWYSDAGLSNLVGSGNNFATGQTAIGTYTYYATQTVNNCEGNAVAVVLNIIAAPVTPVANDVSVCVGSTVPNLVSSSGNNIQWYDDATLTNVVNTGSAFNTNQTAVGVYTYYVTDSLPGCISSADTVVLAINAIPAAPTASNVTVCAGSTVPNLTAVGSNIVWYKESMLILYAGSGTNLATGQTQVGTYTYYATQTVNGCTSSAIAVSLTINPNPLITLNTYSTNVQAGGSVTLIAFNGANYVWSPSAGLNTTTNDTVIASPDSTTTYTVTGSNAFGCSNSASVMVEVYPVDVVELEAKNWGMEVYPNPNKGVFNVMISQFDNVIMNLKIYNVLGEVVQYSTFSIQHSTFNIDISKQGSGVYFVQMVSEKGVLTKRVIIE